MFWVNFYECLINPGPAEPEYALPFANSVDPDQFASEEIKYVIKYTNFSQQPGSSGLTG